MKKKGWMILALSAVMTAGAAVTSQAAGWRSDNGVWVYEDSSGYLVYNEWKRGADNQWRYLDSNGQMAVNRWVDDIYYVDENGVMVTSGWKQLSAGPAGETDDICWYYFQTNGKAITDSWKKIDNKWYHFNSEAAMETGWVDGDMYFCTDSGAAMVGWGHLVPPNEDVESWSPYDEDEGLKWYYFNSSGKKYVPADGADYAEKRIDGAYYCFDYNGIMQTGWVQFGDSGNSGSLLAGYRFYGPDGKGVTGWYSAYPPEELAGEYEDDVDWFYFTKSGVPKVGRTEATSNDFVRINGKTYLFNEKGNPARGLQKVEIESGVETAYYFDENTRVAVKGRKEIVEGDGTPATYYFLDSGKGCTGVNGGYLYYEGKLQKAEEGSRYQPVLVNGKAYLINTSGRVTKNTNSAKDGDGNKYTTNKDGVVIKMNGEPVESNEIGMTPVPPVWW